TNDPVSWTDQAVHICHRLDPPAFVPVLDGISSRLHRKAVCGIADHTNAVHAGAGYSEATAGVLTPDSAVSTARRPTVHPVLVACAEYSIVEIGYAVNTFVLSAGAKHTNAQGPAVASPDTERLGRINHQLRAWRGCADSDSSVWIHHHPHLSRREITNVILVVEVIENVRTADARVPLARVGSVFCHGPQIALRRMQPQA